MKNNPFLAMPAGERENEQLTPIGSWGAATHVWNVQELDALALCQASGRPLLIRGEPGSGKSQVARAAAARLAWDFHYEVITARHEAQDLLWRYDAVERLATANKGERTRMRDFVSPGPLWWALNPAGAHDQSRQARETANNTVAEAAPAFRPRKGTVVLLDEIDKADSELPNSLLEVLANGGFTLPWGDLLRTPGAVPTPTLIIITSNEERELPAAFVRRCVCLNLVPPPDENREIFLDWLKTRASAHFPELHADVLQAAAVMVHTDRIACPIGMGARPGLAEYLDLLRALHNIAPGDTALQQTWLQRLAPYALLKQYPHDQSRGLGHIDPREQARS